MPYAQDARVTSMTMRKREREVTAPTVDVLAVGAHPDDAEIGCAGILLLAKRWGFKTGILDLTRGEASSRGTPAQREAETRDASEILGLSYRGCLQLKDTELVDSVPSAVAVAEVLRELQPSILLAPFPDDPHPDHVAAGQLTLRARFLSGVKSRSPNRPSRPKLFMWYPLQRFVSPTFALDITEVYETKRRAIEAHASQFSKTAKELGIVPVGIGDYLWHLESRSRFYGSLCDGRYGEVLIAPSTIPIKDLQGLLV